MDAHHNFSVEGDIFVHNCDPFQGVYDTVTLTDGTKLDRVGWAYPDFFEPVRSSSSQLDSHGAASEPLVILPGGYQIAASIGRESSIFAKTSAASGVQLIEHHEQPLSASTRARKTAPGSRAMRIIESVR